jgi:hypothetical protein
MSSPVDMHIGSASRECGKKLKGPNESGSAKIRWMRHGSRKECRTIIIDHERKIQM